MAETSLISNVRPSRAETQWQGTQAMLPGGSGPHPYAFSISHTVPLLNTTGNVRITK